MHDIAFYAGAALSATIYAAILEAIGRETYEPDFTVVTVMLGVALTGAWVALRLLAPLPDLAPTELAWWVWRLMFWMFVATGLPVTAWQIWQARKRIRQLAAYLTRSRHEHAHATDPASPMAVPSRGLPALGADRDADRP
jgi:hypothetical protein